MFRVPVIQYKKFTVEMFSELPIVSLVNFPKDKKNGFEKGNHF